MLSGTLRPQRLGNRSLPILRVLAKEWSGTGTSGKLARGSEAITPGALGYAGRRQPRDLFSSGEACWLRRCRPADRLSSDSASLLGVDHALKAADSRPRGARSAALVR